MILLATGTFIAVVFAIGLYSALHERGSRPVVTTPHDLSVGDGSTLTASSRCSTESQDARDRTDTSIHLGSLVGVHTLVG